MFKKIAQFFGWEEKQQVGCDSHKEKKTCIYVHCDIGYPNSLYIRGEGAELNWEKGQPLINRGPDLWVWETCALFDHCCFKVLINDQQYEKGENHRIAFGDTFQYSPSF